jgi:hypothetical protein
MHLQLAILRNRADGYDARLQAAEECNYRVERGAHLEQGAVIRLQAAFLQHIRHRVGAAIELGEGQ